MTLKKKNNLTQYIKNKVKKIHIQSKFIKLKAIWTDFTKCRALAIEGKTEI